MVLWYELVCPKFMCFIYCLDHHFPISILYIYAYMHACSTYTRQSCLFRTTLYMQYVLHCTGSGQQAQATASHAQVAASRPRPWPAKPWPGGRPSSPGSGQQPTYTCVLKAKGQNSQFKAKYMYLRWQMWLKVSKCHYNKVTTFRVLFEQSQRYESYFSKDTCLGVLF